MTDCTRFILIRHGQTDWNATGRWQGQANPPLNAVGRAQAQQTAQELIAQNIEVLISSDLTRARETAAIIGASIGVPVNLEPRLREINLGDWQGLYSDDIRARWPDEMRTWLESPLAIRPPTRRPGQRCRTALISAVGDADERPSVDRDPPPPPFLLTAQPRQVEADNVRAAVGHCEQRKAEMRAVESPQGGEQGR